MYRMRMMCVSFFFFERETGIRKSIHFYFSLSSNGKITEQFRQDYFDKKNTIVDLHLNLRGLLNWVGHQSITAAKHKRNDSKRKKFHCIGWNQGYKKW